MFEVFNRTVNLIILVHPLKWVALGTNDKGTPFFRFKVEKYNVKIHFSLSWRIHSLSIFNAKYSDFSKTNQNPAAWPSFRDSDAPK